MERAKLVGMLGMIAHCATVSSRLRFGYPAGQGCIPAYHALAKDAAP